jgi:hypothetical protein
MVAMAPSCAWASFSESWGILLMSKVATAMRRASTMRRPATIAF